VIHKQHVGFNVEKPYRNVAVTFWWKWNGHSGWLRLPL
jgi:hypothetical protein